MGFIKEIGDQVSRGFRGVSNSMNAPDVYKWQVLPFIITFVTMILLAGPPTYIGLREVNNCKEKNRIEEGNVRTYEECELISVHPMLRLLIILVMSLVVAGLVAMGTFRIGIYVKNPKLAMGIETTRIVKNVFTN
tara:strand:+ start:84 stop:488 length:405 start_codon:yes stop_codon:yes gene_type:complete